MSAQEEVVSLDISRQHLKCLPVHVRHLQVLHCLNAERNQLSAITQDCAFLEVIEWLNLSHNEFRGIPMKVVFMTNLQVLHITHNPLSRVPSWISELQHLCDLRLPIIEAESLKYIRNDTECKSVVGCVRRAVSIHTEAPQEEEDNRPLLVLPKLAHLVFTLERYDPRRPEDDMTITIRTHHVFSYATTEGIARAIQSEDYNRIYYHKDAEPFFTLALKSPSKHKDPIRKKRLRMFRRK